MLPTPDLLEARVVEMFALWRVPLGAPVVVSWNSRLRSTAGRAFYREGRIELNPALLERSPDQIDTVLVHEAAHVAAHRLFGSRCPAHGRHWRGLMRLAGLPPDVTHALPVPLGQRSRRRERIYLRVCDACGGRRIARIVRYDACACGAVRRFFVLRAPATAGGLDALRNMSLAEARERCGTALK